MVHRGPDGAGLWISPDGRVGLGHRRLSIIDLSQAASQPMCNEDGTLWISFNGEIYNHAEIRKELNRIGRHHWKTDHSDTEVILHAFEEWGIECLSKFRGMFAIALWDTLKRELWLIRDRIGVKPLYYSVHHNRIIFASEIKALLKDPEQMREVHEKSLYHYLTFLTTPAPQTLFKGIQKLPPATWMKISADGRMQEVRYWDVWDHTIPLLNLTEEEIAERVMAELRDSVAIRKVSDVPVGVFLSGGIDSSTNAALFSDGERAPIMTFTVGYDRDYGTYQNELHYARFMAERVGAKHHERLLNLDDLIGFLPQMIHLQDEPIADPVCFPLYFVSKLARDSGVTVCQVGEGADELFYGYPGWKTMLQVEKWNNLPVPTLFKNMGLYGLQMAGKGDTTYYEWLRRAVNKQPVFWGGAEAFNESQKQRILSPRMKKEFASLTSWEVIKPIRDVFNARTWEKTDLKWMSYLDLRFRLPELLLMRVDKMSMGVGLEGRVPFLDHQLVELAMSIPDSLKFKNGVLKYILKKAVRGHIPNEIIDRKKQGFNAPVREWMMGKLKQVLMDELEYLFRHTDYFDRSEVLRFVEEDQGKRSWYLLNFALWWRTYVSTG